MTTASSPQVEAMAPRSPAATQRNDGDAVRRTTAIVLFTYLLVTTPALVFAGVRGVGGTLPVMVALHAAGLLVFGRWARPGRYPAARWAELLPLLIIPVLYAEIPLLIAGLGSAYQDAAIQTIEAAVFGGQPAQTLASHLPFRSLSELLHLAYLAYYPLLYVPAFLVAWRGERARLREIVFTLLLAFLTFYVIFAVYPVQGPRYLWPAPDGIPHGLVRSAVLAILEGGSSRGTAFPSAHLGVTVAVALVLSTWNRRLGAAVFAVAAGLGIGAVYGGFHYAVDMIAGAMLGALSFAAARFLMQRGEHRA